MTNNQVKHLTGSKPVLPAGGIGTPTGEAGDGPWGKLSRSDEDAQQDRFDSGGMAAPGSARWRGSIPLRRKGRRQLRRTRRASGG